MAIVVVVGMPGSGKSKLIEEYKRKGYKSFDVIRKDNGWDRGTEEIKRLHDLGRNIVVSDVEFCRQEWRERLEQKLGFPVEWIYFENNPYVCALNCCYRVFVEGKGREVGKEIANIVKLTKVYRPTGDIRPVIAAEERLRG